jgi:predicted kinase
MKFSTVSNLKANTHMNDPIVNEASPLPCSPEETLSILNATGSGAKHVLYDPSAETYWEGQSWGAFEKAMPYDAPCDFYGTPPVPEARWVHLDFSQARIREAVDAMSEGLMRSSLIKGSPGILPDKVWAFDLMKAYERYIFVNRKEQALPKSFQIKEALETMTLMVTVGLPYSGKSTWARRKGFPIVSPDAIRLALHGHRFIPEAEPMVHVHAQLMVQSLFLAGHRTVILDATHTTRKRRDEWASTKWVRHFVVVPTSKEVCLARAEAHHDYVIPSVIERMAGQLEDLELDEFVSPLERITVLNPETLGPYPEAQIETEPC